MIESRYSIEYIDPSSDKSPSKLRRFFIYSMLTISILAAIIALIYSNLPNSTSQVITEKVQQFISSFNEPSNIPVEKEIIISEPTAPVITPEEKSTETDDTKDELPQQKLNVAQLEGEYKKEIERLSQENTTQHNETVKQLTVNQSLTKKLDLLSKQLKSEAQKRALLKKEVKSLQTKNKTVSSLLKKTEETVKNYTNKIKKLDQRKIKVVTQPLIITPESIDINQVAPPEAVVIKKVVKLTEENSKTNKNKASMSQMDAIVAAMEAAKSTSNNQNAAVNNSTVKK